MADDGGTGERTEEATPKKRQDARERGQVLKSQEVVSVGMVFIMVAAFRALLPTLTANVGEFMSKYLSSSVVTPEILDRGSAQIIWQDIIYNLLIIMLPLLAIGLVAAIVVNIVQTGFLFTTKALQPQLNRLNPLEGIKRMFSMRTLFQLLITTAKIVLVGFIIYNAIKNNLDENIFSELMSINYRGSILQGAEIIFDTAIQIMAVLAGLAALDFFYQRQKFEKDLRMSKYEIKMEYKQQEGDPQVKSRIKQKQREMAMMRMMDSVPDADVVITNPTEYAVALKYDESIGDAPMVIAKGREKLAQKIKEVAREAGVEMVEDRPLARSLYAMCEIGDFIPVEMYQAVAEILAQVFRKKNKMP